MTANDKAMVMVPRELFDGMRESLERLDDLLDFSSLEGTFVFSANEEGICEAWQLAAATLAKAEVAASPPSDSVRSLTDTDIELCDRALRRSATFQYEIPPDSGLSKNKLEPCPYSDGNSCEQYRLQGQRCQDCPLLRNIREKFLLGG